MTDVKPSDVIVFESEKVQSVRANVRQYSELITKDTSYVELK